MSYCIVLEKCPAELINQFDWTILHNCSGGGNLFTIIIYIIR